MIKCVKKFVWNEVPFQKISDNSLHSIYSNKIPDIEEVNNHWHQFHISKFKNQKSKKQKTEFIESYRRGTTNFIARSFCKCQDR